VLTIRNDGRAVVIGARLQISSKPGCGTELKLSIPIEPAAPARQHVAGSTAV
jgi:hypothetical protein